MKCRFLGFIVNMHEVLSIFCHMSTPIDPTLCSCNILGHVFFCLQRIRNFKDAFSDFFIFIFIEQNYKNLKLTLKKSRVSFKTLKT